MTREQLESLHKYRLAIPVGTSGDWAIEKYFYTEESARDKRSGYPYDPDYESFPNVEYTRLVVSNPPQIPVPEQLKRPGVQFALSTAPTVMSDEPYEIAALLSFVEKAYGNVVITGLGLGVLLSMLENKPNITKITVIENSSDVLALSGTYWQNRLGDKLRLVEADAFKWTPDEVYDCAFHDMIAIFDWDWDLLCAKYPADIMDGFLAEAWRS